MTSDPGGDDRAGEAVAMFRRGIGDYRHRAQQPQSFQSQQLRVARPDTERIQLAAFCRHSARFQAIECKNQLAAARRIIEPLNAVERSGG